MQPWLFSKLNEEYSLSSDWDNNWRTGGTVEEVIEEAHLDPQSIFQASSALLMTVKRGWLA